VIGTRTIRSRDLRWLGAWIFVIALTTAIGMLPRLVHIGPPEGALTITDARFNLEGETDEEAVSLPYSWTGRTTPHDVANGIYRLSFRVSGIPSEPLFLLVPAASHNIEVEVNGQGAMSALDTAWSFPTSGYSFLARIPDGAVHVGDNEIVFRQTREIGWLPARLSQVSVGTASAVMPTYRLSNLLIEQVRSMTFALHILLAIGIAIVWTVRRHDPVFFWLALISITSLAVIFTQSPLAPLDGLEQFQSTAAMSAVGLMAIGMALAVAGWQRPRFLLPAIVIVPAILVAAGWAGLVHLPVVGLVSAGVALVAYVVAAGILAHQFARSRDWDAAVLAVPCALTVWFGVHDMLVVTGRSDAPFLLTSYGRTLMLIAIMVILMGRLARSLNGLDDVNETLTQRLAAQEAELGSLHEKERAHATRMIREGERERLMQDLHDGVSGHLVTIIALAERNTESGDAIEGAARAALDDLRLVIHSLDLGDGDLRVALAAFREKLEPQLRRLGIEFRWSTERLPEVTGVTPRNALSVLRILQEAITNAVKHGPARRITIEGNAGEEQTATLHVFNDCAGQIAAGKGNGLGNIRRRARELGGYVNFKASDDGATLLLVLPTHLPE
jgi:signal transduction histidine kinase